MNNNTATISLANLPMDIILYILKFINLEFAKAVSEFNQNDMDKMFSFINRAKINFHPEDAAICEKLVASEDPQNIILNTMECKALKDLLVLNSSPHGCGDLYKKVRMPEGPRGILQYEFVCKQFQLSVKEYYIRLLYYKEKEIKNIINRIKIHLENLMPKISDNVHFKKISCWGVEYYKNPDLKEVSIFRKIWESMEIEKKLLALIKRIENNEKSLSADEVCKQFRMGCEKEINKQKDLPLCKHVLFEKNIQYIPGVLKISFILFNISFLQYLFIKSKSSEDSLNMGASLKEYAISAATMTPVIMLLGLLINYIQQMLGCCQNEYLTIFYQHYEETVSKIMESGIKLVHEKINEEVDDETVPQDSTVGLQN